MSEREIKTMIFTHPVDDEVVIKLTKSQYAILTSGLEMAIEGLSDDVLIEAIDGVLTVIEEQVNG